MLAPSESSLEPPIIYRHTPRFHQPTILNSPEAGIFWNKRWSCIQEGEETSWCPEVSESGGERVQQGELSADIPQCTELPPSLLRQTRTSYYVVNFLRLTGEAWTAYIDSVTTLGFSKIFRTDSENRRKTLERPKSNSPIPTCGRNCVSMPLGSVQNFIQNWFSSKPTACCCF